MHLAGSSTSSRSRAAEAAALDSTGPRCAPATRAAR